MDNASEAVKIRQKYQHFRILVIGRANAGKTTLLKRVCNTKDDPCIYNEQSKDLVLFQVILETSDSPLTIRFLKQIEPTSDVCASYLPIIYKLFDVVEIAWHS
jgi:GTPase SAR1 family protein